MCLMPSLIQMTFIMLEGCLRQMTFILPRLGEYGVSIIHINRSTIAISIVEPQNDADTFINTCGETGERPAIRVMLDNVSKALLSKFVHRENVKVYNGLLEFAANNMLTDIPFADVVRNATRTADNLNMSVIEYLAELGKDCIGDDEI